MAGEVEWIKKKLLKGKRYKSQKSQHSNSAKAKRKIGKSDNHIHTKKVLVLQANGKKRFITVKD